MAKQILRITSHAGHSRYLATLDDEPVGYIPRRADIPSPYAYSPTHTVYNDPKRGRVIIVETLHKRYDVFSVGSVFATEADAEQAYMRTLRTA